MSLAWEVAPYTPEAFRRILARDSSRGVVNEKLHSIFFDEYFAAVSAKTVVVESEYFDRDYLEDFAGYYVRCFTPYSRTCRRLHFFSESFDATSFESLLEGRPTLVDKEKLRTSYLGFLVARPLPQAVIGRTCLATYPSDGGRRHFPLVRRYEANLFGIQLSVLSLAFQEQDTVAAACATSALWTAFHGTGVHFQHRIPSPVEITRNATEHALVDGRALPSAGLFPIQMLNAIKRVDLEPSMVRVSEDSAEHFKSTVYAYVKGGVPVLIVARLDDFSDPNQPVFVGRHAVVVTGYSRGLENAAPFGPFQSLWTSSRIDRLYCHDDQVGPFARLPIVTDGPRFHLETSWFNRNGEMGGVRIVPEHVIVPLYHKIRITIASVRDEMVYFEAFLSVLRNSGPSAFPPHLEWDIFLTSVNAFKASVATEPIEGPLRRALLEQPMPRFIWRARGFASGRPMVDLLFDATGITRSNFCFRVVEWDTTLGDFLRTVIAAQPDLSRLESRPWWGVTSRFLQS